MDYKIIAGCKAMDRLDEFIFRKKGKDLFMQYDPDNYSVLELRLVYKHCEVLYSEYMMWRKKGFCKEAAKNDCIHYWENRGEFFKGKMPEEEYERLKNELSFIRLELGI